ncbi:hypothetical protein [Aeromonas phage 4L372D]|uniref:Uncharacterized protein n=1 Tax=Aeromonas phage 4L372D TaxID=2588518 RepID=A0A5B9N808_9CAUD|nr:hypothetical protein HWC27_gp193 [Aeromonas phage 4L372D]QEG08662.1 hypothetical protein [Aeromonas phage 4L372D]
MKEIFHVTNKKYYAQRGQYLVVIDALGNRLVEVILKHNKCRKQFDTDLVLLYDVPMEIINNVQIYLDGVRIR